MTAGAGAEGRVRVLFVHPTKSPFIQSDIDLLSRHFHVRVVDVGSRRRTAPDMAGAFWELLRGVLWADLVYCWFAERHAKWAVLLARMLRRPALVVVGGYEVAQVPAVGYGSLLDPGKARMVKQVLERATAVLAVSGHTERQILACSAPRRLELVHNGVDTEKFRPGPAKENLVVTVGSVSDERKLRLKGWDTFLEAAGLVPEARFQVVGPIAEHVLSRLEGRMPGNVCFSGYVPHEDLAGVYGKAKVYCQLSMHESFGIALAEAMSCGCVPVVTAAGALPEVVGDAGYVVPVGDAKAAAGAIREALGSGDGRKARERVKSLFSLELRERKLVELVRQLAGARRA